MRNLVVGFLLVVLSHSGWGDGSKPRFDCGKEPGAEMDALTRGEWILRCRYRDAQPQYLQASLARIFKKLSPNMDLEKSLSTPEFRARIFETYGLYFDDRRVGSTLPSGLNVTKTKSAPLMVDEEGSFSIFRYARATKNRASLSVNCLICHSSIVPTKVDGVGEVSFGTPNVFADLQRLHEDLMRDLRENESKTFPGSGSPGHVIERNPVGNSFVNSADFYGIISTLIRDPFPSANQLLLAKYLYASPESTPEVAALSELAQSQPFLKTQPWSSYRYKKPIDKLYVDGGFSGNSAAVTYRLAFSLDRFGEDYSKYSEEFKTYVSDFLMTVKPPQYPFSVRTSLVSSGHTVYQNKCAHCHGGIEKEEGGWKLNYTGEIVSNIGTDDQRYRFFKGVVPNDPATAKYKFVLEGMTAKIVYNKGYIAPPLMGIWARAPYLHNASVANIRQLLGKPAERYRKFGMWPRPAEHENYDQQNIGWKAVDLSDKTAAGIDGFKKSDPRNANLRVYDPEVRFTIFDKRPVPGLQNVGHDLGQEPFDGYLENADMEALIEFLKTI